MYYLYKFSGSDEVDRVLIVFFHARTNGEDVGVEDDVVGIKSHFANQQLVGPSADLHFMVCICGLRGQRTRQHIRVFFVCLFESVSLCVPPHLSLLIEGHDHNSSSIAPDCGSSLQELLLSLLQADAVDDALPLTAFEPRLNH